MFKFNLPIAFGKEKKPLGKTLNIEDIDMKKASAEYSELMKKKKRDNN